MKQIYGFDNYNPPLLTAARLEAELERRRIRRQLAAVITGGVFLELVLILFCFALATESMLAAAALAGLVFLNITAGGVLAFVFINRRATDRKSEGVIL